MDSDVQETRSVPLSNVVVTADSLRELVDILETAIAQIGVDKDRFSFELQTADGTRYSSKSRQILSKNGILDNRQVDSVTVRVGDFTRDIEVEVRVTHGDASSMWNRISVRAKDSMWVSGLLRKFEEAIDNWEKPPSWPTRHRLLLF